MSKFKITWPNGTETTEVSESETLAAYAMERWGCNTMEELTAMNVKLAFADQDGGDTPQTGTQDSMPATDATDASPSDAAPSGE